MPERCSSLGELGAGNEAHQPHGPDPLVVAPRPRSPQDTLGTRRTATAGCGLLQGKASPPRRDAEVTQAQQMEGTGTLLTHLREIFLAASRCL